MIQRRIKYNLLQANLKNLGRDVEEILFIWTFTGINRYDGEETDVKIVFELVREENLARRN